MESGDVPSLAEPIVRVTPRRGSCATPTTAADGSCWSWRRCGLCNATSGCVPSIPWLTPTWLSTFGWGGVRRCRSAATASA
jgi:hypothetical protein